MKEATLFDATPRLNMLDSIRMTQETLIFLYLLAILRFINQRDLESMEKKKIS